MTEKSTPPETKTVDMRTNSERRLLELKGEMDSGQKMDAELTNKQAELRQTLLRISGAIQVLEEMLAQADADAPKEETKP